jgi:hypothetical protein
VLVREDPPLEPTEAVKLRSEEVLVWVSRIALALAVADTLEDSENTIL